MLLKRKEFWLCTSITLCGALFVQAKWPAPEVPESSSTSTSPNEIVYRTTQAAESQIHTMKVFGEARFDATMCQSRLCICELAAGRS
jgi:hypothetical protein